MENYLELIDRRKELFQIDIKNHSDEINSLIESSNFLVIGAAGSIGQAVTKELFSRSPKKLHCIDINENNLVELVRDIRSSYGYTKGEFKTFVIDAGSENFWNFLDKNNSYDYVLNLSALKHVRSESDIFSLLRMIEVNILNTVNSLDIFKSSQLKKYFCVSTDKAANPVNLMGASKRIMELFLSRYHNDLDISSARFANVAFSNGSLLDGFSFRLKKKQPLAAPIDIERYFVTPKESGELCLMSCLLGLGGDIFFPKLNEDIHLIKFSDIAIRFLKSKGYEPYFCESEDEAREDIDNFIKDNRWPCFFDKSNTTGEKPFEEFYRSGEKLDMKRFKEIGIVKNTFEIEEALLKDFIEEVYKLKGNPKTSKKDILNLFKICIPYFDHYETDKFLDDKM